MSCKHAWTMRPENEATNTKELFARSTSGQWCVQLNKHLSKQGPSCIICKAIKRSIKEGRQIRNIIGCFLFRCEEFLLALDHLQQTTRIWHEYANWTMRKDCLRSILCTLKRKVNKLALHLCPSLTLSRTCS